MPEDHQKYLEWNGDRFRKWAERIGINTYTVVKEILTSKSVEQHTYRSYMGLLKLLLLIIKYSPRYIINNCISMQSKKEPENDLSLERIVLLELNVFNDFV